jgi:hypothetical protein
MNPLFSDGEIEKFCQLPCVDDGMGAIKLHAKYEE